MAAVMNATNGHSLHRKMPTERILFPARDYLLTILRYPSILHSSPISNIRTRVDEAHDKTGVGHHSVWVQ